MAKQSGLGDNFYLHGYDVSGDLGSVSVSGGPAALEVTGIDKSAFERIGGLRTGGMSWQAWFNPASADIWNVRVCLSALTETLPAGE